MLLSYEFSEIPLTFIDACLSQSRHQLFPTYRVLEEAFRTHAIKPAYNKMKGLRKSAPMYREDDLATLFKKFEGKLPETEVLHELQAARRLRRKADLKRAAERQLELDEEENVRISESEGTMQECGCCFGDYPRNRMVHCKNEVDLHFFCRGCARKAAETEIGASKYELHCMSMEGCDSGFSIEQRYTSLCQATFSTNCWQIPIPRRQYDHRLGSK